jgi:hypothetical protein
MLACPVFCPQKLFDPLQTLRIALYEPISDDFLSWLQNSVKVNVKASSLFNFTFLTVINFGCKQ